MIKMYFTGATHPGMVRKNNEDAFICQNIWDEQHVLCVAIDGLGGYEGGEIAAGIARDTIIAYLYKNRMGNPLDLLKQAVTQANNDIVTSQAQNPDCNRMGCVLTAGLFELQEGRLNMAHVGDSRLYQWHEGNLRKLSHDHSLVGYREDTGKLTEEEAMNHPQRNIVERVLGERIHHLEDKGFIESAIFPINDGMRFIFCSDGLTDMITSAEISLIVQNHLDDLDACVGALIKSACDHGGRDNVTVVMSCYINDESGTDATEGVSTVEDKPTTTITPPAFRAPEESTPQDDSGDQAVKPTSPAIPATPVQSTTSNTHPEPAEPDETEDGRRRHFPWRAVLFLAFAIAACLASLYGGYRMGYRQHYIDLENKVADRDSVITVMQDSLRHVEQEKYDLSVKLDSINHKP